MSDPKKRPVVDVLGSFLEQAKLDRVVQEEAEKSDEQIAAGLVAAGVTRKQVDAVFARQMDALLRHGPQVTWGLRLKYVGLGALLGFGLGLGVGVLVSRPPSPQPPVIDVGAEDAGQARTPARSDLIATTPVSAGPLRTASPPLEDDEDR